MAEHTYHWLTRPLADSVALATTLSAQGIQPLISPIMHITLRDVPPPQIMPDAIILTSRHATHVLNALPAAARELPLFCVGSATAHTAQDLGYQNIRTGDGDVISLLPAILAGTAEGGRILYLSGEEIRVDLPALLKAQKREVERLIAYTADIVEALSDESITALKNNQVTSVSFFSVRSAELAIQMLKQHALAHTASQIDAYCLSLSVAESAAMAPWKSVQVCTSPTTQAMRDLIVSRNNQSVL